MQVVILTSKQRVEKFSDLSLLPADWELTFLNAGSSDAEILAAGREAEFIFADAIAPVSGELISQLPNLKLIHSEGVGYNCIDTAAAHDAGVFVCNNAGANSKAVAEQAVLLMLALLRRLAQGDQMVRSGQQIQAKESFIMDGITELGACRVGIIGLGAIGKATARLLDAFGCEVCYYSRRRHLQLESGNLQYLPLEELANSCDVVSLHLPVTPKTTRMVDESFLQRMKSTAILINTARGEVVDQVALAQALVQKRIAGAGLDTLDPEPVKLDNPLLGLPEEVRYRVIFSPHIGGTTSGVFMRAHRMVWENIAAVARGERPKNIVNGL